jgi:hypothetical protein
MKVPNELKAFVDLLDLKGFKYKTEAYIDKDTHNPNHIKHQFYNNKIDAVGYEDKLQRIIQHYGNRNELKIFQPDDSKVWQMSVWFGMKGEIIKIHLDYRNTGSLFVTVELTKEWYGK